MENERKRRGRNLNSDYGCNLAPTLFESKGSKKNFIFSYHDPQLLILFHCLPYPRAFLIFYCKELSKFVSREKMIQDKVRRLRSQKITFSRDSVVSELTKK